MGKLLLPVANTWIVTAYKSDHQAIDFGFLRKYNATKPLPVVAAHDGYVTLVVNNEVRDITSGKKSYGNQVMINNSIDGEKTRYAHLEKGSVTVKVGQKVVRGQVIGIMGNTGYSFGRHLHFEVYKNGIRVNPFAYLDIPTTKMVKGAVIETPVVIANRDIELLKLEISNKDGIIKTLKEQIEGIKKIIG
jgi:murein DD-endopeptidase MepM/ murein hydrolase activator NlpD